MASEEIMIDHRNPDAAEIFRDRYAKITDQFQHGIATEPVLRATLHGLGYIGIRLEAEIAYQQLLRDDTFKPLSDAVREVVAELAGRGGFTSGLP